MIRHIPQLDGLRALAILLVLVTHFWGYPEGHTILNRFAQAGWMGVDLFFVLSGFLITSILWESRERPKYFINFYARRSLRIFPLYYLLLILVFICLPFVSKLPEQLSQDSWMYWLYLGNVALASGGWQLFLIDITWSLSVEEQFYLVWPAVIRKLTYKRMVVLCLSMIVAAPLIRFALWEPDRWMWLHMMMPLRADSFALGGLIAVLTKHGVRLPARTALVVSGAVLVALIASGEFRRETMLVGTIGYTLTSLVAGAGLIVAMNTRVLAVQPLLHIGKVSYGMYIYHPLLLIVVTRGLAALGFTPSSVGGFAVQFVVLVAITVAAATVSFALFETPLLRLKRYFEPGDRARPAPPAQTVAIEEVAPPAAGGQEPGQR